MKIIGKSNNGYIIDATRDEVINLIGYYGQYDLERHKKSLNVGDNINISAMYKQLYALASKHDEIVKTQDTLRKCIEYLNEVLPVIDVDVRENE